MKSYPRNQKVEIKNVQNSKYFYLLYTYIIVYSCLTYMEPNANTFLEKGKMHLTGANEIEKFQKKLILDLEYKKIISSTKYPVYIDLESKIIGYDKKYAIENRFKLKTSIKNTGRFLKSTYFGSIKSIALEK